MRLIDVDVLIKRFEVLRDEHETHSISYDALYVVLLQQPTAYDVDKVVEKLEIEMKASSGYSEERVSAFSRAIEIVKHGGISDDVCEWKQDNMSETVYMVCDGFYTTVYQKDFEYCPYCGKKIKIVGD